jgi:hypothetical protein
MAHGMDTNVNEAFNQICTWFAPKNKVFAGSGSLHNRLSFAVGINSLGYNEFFTALFQRLGIEMTDNVAHYLRIKENTRVKRLAKIRTKESKLSKSQAKRTKLAGDTRLAKTEFLKREGTYRKGMNVDDPYGELPADGNDNEDNARKPAARTNNNNAKLYCEYCGKKGHATKKSRKCTAPLDSNKKYRRTDGTSIALPARAVVPEATATADLDADDNFLMPASILDDDHQLDCHETDCIPFDNEVQDDDSVSDLDLFHDTTTWEDEDGDESTGNVLRTGVL